jgi:hypothetical protein
MKWTGGPGSTDGGWGVSAQMGAALVARISSVYHLWTGGGGEGGKLTSCVRAQVGSARTAFVHGDENGKLEGR